MDRGCLSVSDESWLKWLKSHGPAQLDPAGPLCRAAVLPAALPAGFQLRQQVFCAVHGREGKVTGPSSVDTEKRVLVRFLGSYCVTDCRLNQLSPSWPPPPLAGGYQPSQRVFYCGTGANVNGSPFTRLEFGKEGTVAGPCTGCDPELRLQVGQQ